MPDIQDSFNPGNGLPADPDARLGDLKQLRDISRRYMDENYWKEFEEVWRSSSCRTAPIMIKNEAGVMVEDTNRTNIAMPEIALLIKRKTARLTANPPNMRYIVPGDGDAMLSERLTARNYYEYDRSGEAVEFRRGVQQAETFGFTYFKTYHDTVSVQRQMRYLRAKLTDRRQLMQVQGAEDGQIKEAIAKMGDTVGPQELADAIAQNGREIRGEIPFKLYEGPVTKCRFIGDILLEPEALTLNSSGWVFEQYNETDIWLKDMSQRTYTDPETQHELPVFSKDACDKLLSLDSKLPQDRLTDLKRRLRNSVQQSQARMEKRLLPEKRFEIDEFHAADKNGRIWIEYFANDSVYLGRQPYAFDFWGRYTYTEFVPWPNLIGAIGDSSPRLLRFLHRMHNQAVGMRQDLISNLLRRNYTVDSEEDIPEAVFKRAYGNVMVTNGGSFKPMEENDVPPSAWQTEAQIKSEMMAAEPAIGGVEAAGTDFNPQSGKTATTAILANKSNDALIQLELDSLNICIKELGEKKLEIHRQLADSLIPVPGRFAQEQHLQQILSAQGMRMDEPVFKEQYEALTQRFGKTSLVVIDPLEIQDPAIEVEPEAGSTLAVDDQLKQASLLQFYQMALQNPSVLNVRYAAEELAKCTRGIDPQKAIMPEQTGPMLPKVSLSLTLPLDKAGSVPADILNQLLPAAGLQPSEDATKKQELDAVQQLSETADAAANLHSPMNPQDLALKAQTDRVLNGHA